MSGTTRTPLAVRSPALVGLLALVGANVALAFGPWFVRLAGVGPVTSAFWRMAMAVPILLLATVTTRQLPRGLPSQHWMLLGVGGLFFAADLVAWHAGILQTKLANATLFGNCASLLFPVWGFVVARAWPNRWQVAALALAGIGATLLFARSLELSPAHLVGDLLAALAGVFYTLYLIQMTAVRERLGPLLTLTMVTIAGTPPLLLAALLSGEGLAPQSWLALLALAACSQVAGQGLMIYALGMMSPIVIGIGLLIQPVVAGLIGWFVYGERLGAVDGLGAALVALALVLVRREPRRVAPTGSKPKKAA